MKTNFLILLVIVVATISCEKRSVEMQTGSGTTIEITPLSPPRMMLSTSSLKKQIPSSKYGA